MAPKLRKSINCIRHADIYIRSNKCKKKINQFSKKENTKKKGTKKPLLEAKQTRVVHGLHCTRGSIDTPTHPLGSFRSAFYLLAMHLVSHSCFPNTFHCYCSWLRLFYIVCKALKRVYRFIHEYIFADMHDRCNFIGMWKTRI